MARNRGQSPGFFRASENYCVPNPRAALRFALGYHLAPRWGLVPLGHKNHRASFNEPSCRYPGYGWVCHPTVRPRSKKLGDSPRVLGDSYQNGADEKTSAELEGANRQHGDLLHGITNAEAEGINSKIMLIKRRAGGYRNIENFKTAVLLYCGGLDLDPR